MEALALGPEALAPAPRHEVVHHALREIGARAGLAALILVDHDGFAIASTTPLDTAERLAALTPAMASGELPVRRLADAPTAVREVLHGGRTLYVAAVGDPDACDDVLDEVVDRVVSAL